MGGLGDDVDYGDCKTIKGENDERIVAAIQIVEKIKKRLDVCISIINNNLIPIRDGVELNEKIVHLRKMLCSPAIDKMAVLEDFLVDDMIKNDQCLYCGKSFEKEIGYIKHKFNCIYLDIREFYFQLIDWGYSRDNHQSYKEKRRKIVEWVKVNNPEEFIEGENVMGCGDDGNYDWEKGLPKVEEKDIPQCPNCKPPKKLNKEGDEIPITDERHPNYRVTIPAPDVDTPEDRLNKVRDFFGLKTLDGVKANKLLETSADLFKTKNAEHGDAYLKIGYVLESMFPDGLILKTHHDFNKFTTLVQMLYKITRMCNTCFGEKETIHDSVFDSPRDLCVYGAIFGEIQIKELKDKLQKDAS